MTLVWRWCGVGDFCNVDMTFGDISDIGDIGGVGDVW